MKAIKDTFNKLAFEISKTKWKLYKVQVEFKKATRVIIAKFLDGQGMTCDYFDIITLQYNINATQILVINGKIIEHADVLD